MTSRRNSLVKSTAVKSALIRRLSTLAVAGALLLGTPFAAELGLTGLQAAAAEEEKKQKTRRVPTMSENTFKKLGEAQAFIDEKQFAAAQKVLDDMLARSKRLNGNEVGQVYNMMGFIHFSKEDYDAALDAYEKVIAQGDQIPEGLETTTLYTLAQLSFVAERYQDALDYMETWIDKASNPGADPHIFMGQVYYQMKDFDASIDQIETGIRIAKERDLTIKENWWALLNYLYYEKENWPKVLEILEILVRDFPKRDYWIRLAGIHGQQGNEDEQVWAMQGAYTAGFLDRERDLMNFSGLLMQAEVPYRAATVLSTGFEEDKIERTAKNLQGLGSAWQLAQEPDKAIPVFEEAGKLSDDGKIYERLAQLYLDVDKFEDCVTASENALDKGGVRSTQQVYIIKGMCQFNKDQSVVANLNRARQSFVSCRTEARREEDESNQRVCQQWITYIDRETQRLEQLEAAI
jgi:tetratricopeptide (TPR) repeat protein